MSIKIIILFFITLFISHYSFCQENPRKGEILTETMLTLNKPSVADISAKQVLLYEDSLFKIITSIKNFEEVSLYFLKTYRNGRMSKSDSIFLRRILYDSINSNYINAQNVESQLAERVFLDYLIVECLEQNRCWIQNKIGMKFISEIKRQSYIYRCGFDCGDDGRRYLIENKVFYYIVDMII